MKYEKKIVIYFDISDNQAEKRLTLRKREDDTVESIKKRIDWFNVDVLPVIEYFKENKNYNFIHLNVEKSVENIFLDLKQELEKMTDFQRNRAILQMVSFVSKYKRFSFSPIVREISKIYTVENLQDNLYEADYFSRFLDLIKNC